MSNNKLISYKVFTKTGKQFMTIIVSKQFSLKDLNEYIQAGTNCVVVNQRSGLVNHDFVD